MAPPSQTVSARPSRRNRPNNVGNPGTDRVKQSGKSAVKLRAKQHEVADRLICGDEGAVYGDRAYEGKPRRARLKAAGNGVMEMQGDELGPAAPHGRGSTSIRPCAQAR